MQLKKVLLACLVVILAVSAMAFGASASDATDSLPLKVAVGVSSPTALSNQPLAVNAGDSIEVNVTIEQNPGTRLVLVRLEYDAKVFTLENAVDKGVIKEYATDHVYGEGATLKQSGNGQITYISALSAKDTNANGVLFGLTFKVNEAYDGSQSFTLKMTEVDVMTDRLDASGLLPLRVPVEIANNSAMEIHHFDKGSVVDPTCTEQGYTKFACSKCDYIAKNTFVDAKGHTPTTDAAKDPTCTETGLTEGSHCAVCNEVLVAQNKVDAKGHTVGPDATCTEPQICTVCNVELKPENGHHPGKAATCTEAQTCLVCGEVVTAALGHTPGEAATCTMSQSCTVCFVVLQGALGHDASAATCTVPSSCNRCSVVLSPALGHTPDEAAPATCTTAQLCTVCGESVVAALGHTPGEEATCTMPQSCTVCSAELQGALGHDASVATCTVPSSCNRCSVVLSPALGHTPDEAAPATCTTAQLCTVCGEEAVAALGHTEVIDAAKEPTCTETGLTEGKHCSVCNTVLVAQSDREAVPHTAVVDPAVEPTKEAEGKTEGSHCSVCNTVLIPQETIPMIESGCGSVIGVGAAAVVMMAAAAAVVLKKKED